MKIGNFKEKKRCHIAAIAQICTFCVGRNRSLCPYVVVDIYPKPYCSGWEIIGPMLRGREIPGPWWSEIPRPMCKVQGLERSQSPSVGRLEIPQGQC